MYLFCLGEKALRWRLGLHCVSALVFKSKHPWKRPASVSRRWRVCPQRRSLICVRALVGAADLARMPEGRSNVRAGRTSKDEHDRLFPPVASTLANLGTWKHTAGTETIRAAAIWTIANDPRDGTVRDEPCLRV